MRALNHFELMDSYIPLDLLSAQGFCLAVLVLLGFIVTRYFLMVLPFYAYFWLVPQDPNKLLHDLKIKPQQIRYEIFYSMLGSLIFAIAGYGLGLFWQLGWSRIYLRFDNYPLWYLPLSFLLLLFVHEFYFYFTHRWMHQPAIFRRIHAVHHYSRKTTPWASFSFHPGEAMIQALFLPLVVMIIPVHPVVLLIYLSFMTVTAISNHLGFELLPVRGILRWFISGTHHSLHHEKYNGNFGLYLRFLDLLLETEIDAEFVDISLPDSKEGA